MISKFVICIVPPQIVVSVTIHKEPSMSTLMTTREPLHLTLKNETYQIYTIGDEIRVLVGTDVGIVCALEQDDPPADITWLLPGNYRMRDGATRRRISSSGNSSITSTLLIKNANKHNNGNYTCIAENGAGQTNATSSLVVYHIQGEILLCTVAIVFLVHVLISFSFQCRARVSVMTYYQMVYVSISVYVVTQRWQRFAVNLVRKFKTRVVVVTISMQDRTLFLFPLILDCFLLSEMFC